jgi:nickel superoxide dismutase
VTALALVAIVGFAPQLCFGHCQVPCGIYDDTARIERMLEDATTIEKALNNIALLAGKHDAQSANQLTRWIMTKETHASHIITTVAEYFLTQKVKPVAPSAEGHETYLAQLANHHQVMVAAMKVKQNSEWRHCARPSPVWVNSTARPCTSIEQGPRRSSTVVWPRFAGGSGQSSRRFRSLPVHPAERVGYLSRAPLTTRLSVSPLARMK